MENLAVNEKYNRAEDRISLMGLKKCACGHTRRIHARKRAHDGHVTEHGKCLGGTPEAPMSCECKYFCQ